MKRENHIGSLLQAYSKRKQNQITLRFSMGAWLLFCLCVLPLQAMAERVSYPLRLDNLRLSGLYYQPSTLNLKRIFSRQYPGIDISDFDLVRVILVAKTKFGHGKAQLRVGKDRSRRYNVEGNPRAFYARKHHTFDRVGIHNPAPDSRGRWQVELIGRFMLRGVSLVLEDHRHRISKMRIQQKPFRLSPPRYYRKSPYPFW